LQDDGSLLTLFLADEDRPLYSETVERRHTALANALGRKGTVGKPQGE
jgi:exopolyphosphatase/guanosine-5'-triphosphate,3'-diphosphate pyrophosphatase